MTVPNLLTLFFIGIPLAALPFIVRLVVQNLQAQSYEKQILEGDLKFDVGDEWIMKSLTYTLGITAFFLLLLYISLGSFTAIVVSGFAVAGIFPMAVSSFQFPGKANARILREAVEGAYKKMRTKSHPSQVDELLGHFLATRTQKVSGYVIWALGDWGSPEAFRMLSHFPQSKAPNQALTSIWAMGSHKYQELAQNLTNAADTGGFLKLVDKYSYWRRSDERGVFHTDFDAQFPHLLSFTKAQEKLREHATEAYCTRDRFWAKGRNFKGWEYVVCPVCEKADALETGVKKVIGFVGKDGNGSRVEDGVLRLNLWDTQAEKAQPAEINLLEIHAGADFNLDWAVAGVLEAQANHTTRLFEVQMQESTELTTNTLRLLEKLSGEKLNK